MISQLLCEETIGRARVEKGKIIEKSNSRGQKRVMVIWIRVVIDEIKVMVRLWKYFKGAANRIYGCIGCEVWDNFVSLL